MQIFCKNSCVIRIENVNIHNNHMMQRELYKMYK